MGLTEAWLMTAGKQLIWQRFLQAKLRRPPSEAATAAAPAAGAAAGAAAAAGEAVYKVPADFDPAVLGEPDFSSQAAGERTLGALFLKRWLDLRDQASLFLIAVLFGRFAVCLLYCRLALLFIDIL